MVGADTTAALDVLKMINVRGEGWRIVKGRLPGDVFGVLKMRITPKRG